MKILISGEGGQGVQLISQIIADAAFSQNFNVSYIPHYGVEMRMGISFGFVQIQKETINYPKFITEILVVMTLRELEISLSYIDKNTHIINALQLSQYLEKNNLTSRSLNMLVLGILIKEINTTDFRLDPIKIKSQIQDKFFNQKEILKQNIKAFELGLVLEKEMYSKEINSNIKADFPPLTDSDNKKTHIRFTNLCKGCGLCLEKCPFKVLSWHEKTLSYIGRPVPKIDINKCTACGTCENICPDSAIKIIKK